MTAVDAAEERFWVVAGAVLDRPGVTRSTMMGLPCLRQAGAFFASYDRRTGNLVVKLSEARVADLIETGEAEPFAPAGRRFRQWAAVPPTAERTWAALVAEAHAFAVGA